MSKAFTKETDDLPESPMRRRGIPVPELNLVTPAGLAAARAEHDRLVRDNGDHDRIRELAEHLATAQPMDPPADRSEVGLGARVTVEDDDGKRTIYELVGAIEADPKQGKIGWQAPLAQALWGKRLGDAVTLPKGDGEIVRVEY